jgi:hypothetical protein
MIGHLLLLLACDGGPAPSDTSDDRTVPPVTADPLTVLGHAQECQQALGPIPGFDCLDDAVPVPVFLDGEPMLDDGPSCDRPSLLEGSCNRYTRAGRKMGTWPDGDPRPEVTFVFTCRSSDDGPPTEEGGIYHDVAMIGHNELTGATCFFQSFPTTRVRAFPSPLTAESEPDLGEVDAVLIWDRPEFTARIRCNRCHGADPWIHSPWIDQVRVPGAPWVPNSPRVALVPWTNGNDTPYHVVGTAFEDWQLTHIRPEGNACTTCHRVSPGEACRDFVRYSTGGTPDFMPVAASARVWPTSVWMPPDTSADESDWEQAWRPHVDQLLACCSDPDAEECRRTDTPAHP